MVWVVLYGSDINNNLVDGNSNLPEDGTNKVFLMPMGCLACVQTPFSSQWITEEEEGGGGGGGGGGRGGGVVCTQAMGC